MADDLGNRQPKVDLRIGDAERQAAVDALRHHLGAGRIDIVEFEDRAARAYAARTAADLVPLLRDLPDAQVPRSSMPQSRQVAPLRRGLRLPGHLRPLVGVSTLCVLIWAMSGAHLDNFWPVWVAGPWLVATVLFGGHHGRCGRGHRRNVRQEQFAGPRRAPVAAGDYSGGSSSL